MMYSYNGWMASPYPSQIGVVHFEPIPGYDFPGGIKSGDVKVIFTYLVRQLDARVESIEHYPPGDEWGYAYRANVNDPNSLSCHASATAIDYNATKHPNKIAYTWTRAQSLEIHKIIDDELDGVIKWLEGWDEMHFEIRGTFNQVRAVADKIRAGQVGPTPQPTPQPEPEPEPEEEGPMYRIYYFNGEPTAAGDQTNVTEAYRCLCAKAEKRPKGQDPFIIVDAWHIKDPAELKVWQDRGLATMNKPDSPARLRASINFYGGSFDNTKTP